jgi:hypothetical protein
VVLVGFGEFSLAKWALGKAESDFLIPEKISEVNVDWKEKAQGLLGSFSVEKPGTYRLLFQQMRKNGTPLRVSGGSKAGSKSLGQLLKISASVGGVLVPAKQNYDKIIWSGLSWAVAEINLSKDLVGKAVQVDFQSNEAIQGFVGGKVFFVG